MPITLSFSPWKPMTPAAIADAPTCPGLYELATLVRTVVFIGTAAESLSEALTLHLNAPATLQHPPAGRLYFRVAAYDEPAEAQRELIEAYRASHAGAFPAAQLTQPTPQPAVPRRHLKAV